MRALLATTAAALALTVGISTFSRRPLAPEPMLQVRSVPHQLHAGRLLPGVPVGQTFTPAGPGVVPIRVEVALVRLDHEPTGSIRARLRADGPGGRILAEQVVPESAVPADPGGGFVAFDLGVTGPSGLPARYHVELLPDPPDRIGAVSPYVRFRGNIDARHAWGDRELTDEVHRVRLRATRADLCGFAMPASVLDLRASSARLELVDAEDPSSACTAELAAHDSVGGGYAFFRFDPIPESRWRTYDVEIRVPDGARVIGSAGGPSLVPLYGTAEALPHLVGATRGDSIRDDLDLVLRVAGGWPWEDSPPRARSARILAFALSALAMLALGVAARASAR